jgi:hypothetical protein
MRVVEASGEDTTLRWQSVTSAEGDVWEPLAYYLGDRYTVTP